MIFKLQAHIILG